MVSSCVFGMPNTYYFHFPPETHLFSTTNFGLHQIGYCTCHNLCNLAIHGVCELTYNLWILVGLTKGLAIALYILLQFALKLLMFDSLCISSRAMTLGGNRWLCRNSSRNMNYWWGNSQNFLEGRAGEIRSNIASSLMASTLLPNNFRTKDIY